MSALTVFLVGLNLVCASVNVAIFAVYGNPLNLGALAVNLLSAVFCYWIDRRA